MYTFYYSAYLTEDYSSGYPPPINPSTNIDFAVEEVLSVKSEDSSVSRQPAIPRYDKVEDEPKVIPPAIPPPKLRLSTKDRT